MDLLYACEKYSNAVHVLARGRGNLKDRLYAAFSQLVTISPRDVPAELQADVNWIRQELGSKDAKRGGLVAGKRWSEGRIGATLRTMRIEKAERIAERILLVASRLDELANSR